MGSSYENYPLYDTFFLYFVITLYPISTGDVKEITRDVDNTSDSNVNQGNCSKSLALSTQDTRKL